MSPGEREITMGTAVIVCLGAKRPTSSPPLDTFPTLDFRPAETPATSPTFSSLAFVLPLPLALFSRLSTWSLKLDFARFLHGFIVACLRLSASSRASSTNGQRPPLPLQFLTEGKLQLRRWTAPGHKTQSQTANNNKHILSRQSWHHGTNARANTVFNSSSVWNGWFLSSC